MFNNKLQTEIADYIKKSVDDGVNQFFNSDEFKKIIEYQRFYDDPRVKDNIKNRVINEFARHLKVACKNNDLRNCDVFPLKNARSVMCHRAGVSRSVNGLPHWYCDVHDSERRLKHKAYHTIDFEEYKRQNRRKPYDLQIKAVNDHSRRIKYRRKYNLRHDSRHARFEASLREIYKEKYKCCPNTGRINYVSI